MLNYQDLIKKNRRILNNSNYGTKYIIEPNDNLYEIASRFNTSVEKLKKINNLKSDKLQPGEIIFVDDLYNPESEDIYKKYIVKKNDTIYSIAYNYGMTTNEILEINNLLEADIKEGQTIYVYNNPPLLTDEIIYTVKPGDTLYTIAKEYNTTVDKIKALNQLSEDILTVNTKIIINFENLVTTKATEIYTINPGDTLYSIALKKGISVETLKKLNNLSTDNLTVGQQLLVPRINTNERNT